MKMATHSTRHLGFSALEKLRDNYTQLDSTLKFSEFLNISVYCDRIYPNTILFICNDKIKIVADVSGYILYESEDNDYQEHVKRFIREHSNEIRAIIANWRNENKSAWLNPNS